MTPWLDTHGLRGQSCLDVCEEQKGEARSQQDVPGSCITHSAVVTLKGVGKIPQAEKCPSAGPAAPCAVQDPPIPACPYSWKRSLHFQRSGHLLGIHAGEDRASPHFSSPCSRGEKENRGALACDQAAPRGCEPGVTLLGAGCGSCQEKRQQNNWDPRSSTARGFGTASALCCTQAACLGADPGKPWSTEVLLTSEGLDTSLKEVLVCLRLWSRVSLLDGGSGCNCRILKCFRAEITLGPVERLQKIY